MSVQACYCVLLRGFHGYIDRLRRKLIAGVLLNPNYLSTLSSQIRCFIGFPGRLQALSGYITTFVTFYFQRYLCLISPLQRLEGGDVTGTTDAVVHVPTAVSFGKHELFWVRQSFILEKVIPQLDPAT